MLISKNQKSVWACTSVLITNFKSKKHKQLQFLDMHPASMYHNTVLKKCLIYYMSEEIKCTVCACAWKTGLPAPTKKQSNKWLVFLLNLFFYIKIAKTTSSCPFDVCSFCGCWRRGLSLKSLGEVG